jgi:acetylornithine/succinyldiaminopimelate/putrescine aminotransferase
LIGIVLHQAKAKDVAAALLKRGFLVNAASEDVIRIAPAYIVSDRQIMSFVSAFNEVCEEVFGG